MTESNLFSAFSLNDKIFRNRIILSPMCQYKANNGFIDEWHLQHYSRFAFSGKYPKICSNFSLYLDSKLSTSL